MHINVILDQSVVDQLAPDVFKSDVRSVASYLRQQFTTMSPSLSCRCRRGGGISIPFSAAVEITPARSPIAMQTGAMERH